MSMNERGTSATAMAKGERRRRRAIRSIPGLALAMATVPVLALPAWAAIDTSAAAVDLAHAIADPGTVSGAAFEAVPPSGTPNAVSDTALTAFPTAGPTYAILTTGDANFADDPNGSASTGANLGGGNVRGNTDYDVTVLRIDLDVPEGVNCLLGVEFQFLSEEYPEFVGSSYNDAFIAELDESTWTTSGSTISAPDNFAFDPSGDVISINTTGATAMSPANAAGTTYDGATPLLTAATPITPGAHSLFLSIFDQGDQIYDSAVFVDNLRLGTVENVETDCVPGAQPVDPGFLTIDDEAISDGNVARVTGTITCPVGERYKIELELSQDATSGAGTTTGKCKGTEQPFKMTVVASSGPGFVASPPLAEACAVGQTGISPPQTVTAEDSVCEPVSIVIGAPPGGGTA